MSKHTQSIMIFGLAVPVLIIFAAMGGVMKIRSNIELKRNEKEGNFTAYEQALTEAELLDQKLAKDDRRDKMTYWTQNLEEELIQGLSKNLNTIMSNYTDVQLRRTSLNRPNNRSPLAMSTESKYNRLTLGFEGGFGPMQETLAELELMMPHLTLEALKVTPTRNVTDIPYLEFDVTYLAWAPLSER